MAPRLTTDHAKNYCNRTLIVKVIEENVVTCFMGHSVVRCNYFGKGRIFFDRRTNQVSPDKKISRCMDGGLMLLRSMCFQFSCQVNEKMRINEHAVMAGTCRGDLRFAMPNRASSFVYYIPRGTNSIQAARVMLARMSCSFCRMTATVPIVMLC